MEDEFVYGGIPRSRFNEIVNKHIKDLTEHYKLKFNSEESAIDYIEQSKLLDFLRNPDTKLFTEHLGILIEAVEKGHESLEVLCDYLEYQIGVKLEL